MTDERYREIESGKSPMSDEELKEGWHFCSEWDALLVGPGMDAEIAVCNCYPKDHMLYKNKK